MSVREPLHAGQLAAEVGGVALLWVVLYWLNAQLFAQLQYSTYINWIFLPAAVRVLAVLLFGWRGALGLFMGALITFDMTLGDSGLSILVQTALSALAPWAAVHWTARWLKMNTDLQGLNFRQLALLCLAGAGLSAAAHTMLFSVQAHDPQLLWGFLPMFGGDLLGTLLVVYAAHFALRLYSPGPPKPMG
jgi:hypothetical protein